MSRTPGPPAPGKIAVDPERLVLNVPAAGEIVIFDRSWYNRAGVERVMGFCTEEQSKKFLKGVPLVEQAMVESGILLLKYWLEMSPQEQTRRPKDRIDDGRKVWKLIAMDLKSYSRWFDYSRARDEMFAATDTGFAPWYVVRSDDKRRARLNAIAHLLGRIPYDEPHSDRRPQVRASSPPSVPRDTRRPRRRGWGRRPRRRGARAVRSA